MTPPFPDESRGSNNDLVTTVSDDDMVESRSEVSPESTSSAPHNVVGSVAKQRILQAVSEYDLSISSLTVAEVELRCFERIVETVVHARHEDGDGVLYGGVHVWDEHGHVTLASGNSQSLASIANEIAVVLELHAPCQVPIHQSLCHSILLNHPEPFFTRLLRKGSVFNPLPQDVVFVGCVLYNKDSVGVGLLSVLWDGSDETSLPKELKNTLSLLAMEATEQLELRRILHTKNRAVIQMLQEQIRVLQRELVKTEEKDRTGGVILPSFGQVSQVTAMDLGRHPPSPFLQGEAGSTLSSDAPPRQPRRTALLPMFHNQDSANEQERSHLPDDYFATADAMGVDRTPVHKDDMERVAVVEGLEMQEIQPDDPVGMELKRITVRTRCRISPACLRELQTHEMLVVAGHVGSFI
jgi:hypothetical protein